MNITPGGYLTISTLLNSVEVSTANASKISIANDFRWSHMKKHFGGYRPQNLGPIAP